MRKRSWIILCLVIGLCLALGALADTEGDFTYTVENGEATVTAYVGGGNVVIPDTLGGYPVTAIGYQAFRYGSLTGVAFPSTLTSIGEEAFSGCFYLASVEFPTGLTEIGPFAFEYCAMSSVELPDTVTTVGGYAFRGCAALVDLRLSPAMTRIGNGTFRECTALQSVVIPASVTSIGTAAFQYCSLLSSITIPSSLTAIESSAFGSTAFTQFTCPATVTVVENHAFSDCPNLESLTIWNPDCRLNVGETFAPVSTVIYGRAGSTAQTYAETYDREFVAVTCAHAGETPWTVVTPATCTEEGYRTRICAVCGDTVGESISVIPHTSEEIPAVPATLTESGLTAGARCSVCGTVLTAQETTSPLLTYTVENGEATITACDTSVAGAIVLPDTLGGCPVTAIGASAFWKCSRITSVSVPASVTVIGRAAFSRCSALESISLPAGLTYINTNTFYQCAALSTVEIPAAVTGVGQYAFYDCDALESVTFAAGSQCARIEDDAFHFCGGLAEITLPSTVTSIGQYVFYGCGSLTDFVIPSSVTSIGRYAFLACTGLESVTIPSSVVSLGNGAFSSCHALQSVEILASLTSIGQETFASCGALTGITIPSTVTSIGQNAFSSCVSLENITIPSSVTSIGKYAFSSCALLESITIPASVTSIAEQAFYNCASLNRIVFLNPTCTIYDRAATIPASTTVFGYANSTAQSYAEKYDRSFSAIVCAHGNFGEWTVESEATCAAEGYRTHLCGICNNTVGESIPTLPHTPEAIPAVAATLTETGLTAGSRCSVCGAVLTAQVTTPALLTYTVTDGKATIIDCDTSVSGNIVLPDTLGGYPVTAIGYGAFYACMSLTGVKIPDTVTAISDQAFCICYDLASVEFPSGLLSIGAQAFRHCHALTTLVLPDTVTAVGDSAFRNCTGLTSVSLSSGMTSVSAATFFECTKLQSVTFPSSVESIGSYAFSCCSLRDLTLPSSLTSIGEAAFSICTSITDLTIPASVTNIGDSAFDSCYNLRVTFAEDSQCAILGRRAFASCGVVSVTLPSSVVSIGDLAFLLCSHLESVTVLNPTALIYDRAATIPASTTVFGYANSTAQSYAEKYDRSFSAIVCAHGNFGEWTVESEATCSAEGYRTHLCGICNNTVGESIPALPHTPEAIPAVPATCISTGLTAGSICSVCETILAVQEVVPFAAHNYVKTGHTEPTLAADATDTYTCSVCGGSYNEVIAPTPIEVNFQLNVQFTSEYKIAVQVPAYNKTTQPNLPKASAITTHGIVFTQYGYGAEETTETLTENAPASRIFYTPGIPARRMNDRMTATYYYIQDGVKYVSAGTFDCNLVEYYNRVLASASLNPYLQPAVEAMLNYGSAAQLYFGYNTEIVEEDVHSGLVNRHIANEDNRKSIMDDFADIEAVQALITGGDTAGKALTYNAMSGQFTQKIALVLRYKRVDNTVDPTTLTFRGTYTDALGGEKVVEIAGSDSSLVTISSSYCTLYVSSMPAKDLRCMITGAFYDDSNVQVSDTLTASFESYAVRTLETASETMKALTLATLGYSDAVAAYLGN